MTRPARRFAFVMRILVIEDNEKVARLMGRALLSRTMILDPVWDYHSEALSNVIDVHVRRIRKKLSDPAGETTIRTRREMGYVFGGEAS